MPGSKQKSRRNAARQPEKLQLLGQAEARMRDAFTALSSAALRENNQSFLALAKSSLAEFQQTARVELSGRQKAIEDLVQPLKESLSLVDGKLQQVEQNRVGTHSAITEQLKSLHASQQTLQVETDRLVQALRSPNVRGQWGELQLRRVVEAAGMLELLRLRSQGIGQRRRRPAHSRSDRPPARRQERRGGRESALVGVPRRDGNGREACATEAAAARAPGPRPRVRLGNKTYWQHFQPAPDSCHVRAGRRRCSAPPSSTTRRSSSSVWPRGVMLATPSDVDGAAAGRRVWLAAGEDRQERAGDQRARASALRSHPGHGGALRGGCTRADQVGDAYNGRSARSRAACWSRRGG